MGWWNPYLISNCLLWFKIGCHLLTSVIYHGLFSYIRQGKIISFVVWLLKHVFRQTAVQPNCRLSAKMVVIRHLRSKTNTVIRHSHLMSQEVKLIWYILQPNQWSELSCFTTNQCYQSLVVDSLDGKMGRWGTNSDEQSILFPISMVCGI